MKRLSFVLLTVVLLSTVLFAQDITFGDGSSYVAGFLHGDNRQPIGRFSLAASVDGASFMSVVVNFEGTYTMPTSIYMYPSYGDGSLNQSSSIGSGTRSGNSVTISIYVSSRPISTTATNYYVCIDDGSSTATGSVRCVIASASSFTIASGALVTTITNAYLSSTSVTLPVEIASFLATSSRAGVLLEWSTKTETNNYGFEIERRAVKSEQQRVNSWQKIGFVAGNGTSNSPKEYSYLDATASSGSYVYRLKQIDQDGSFKYSQSIEVSLMAPAGFDLGQNFPNPFNPSTTFHVALPIAGDVKLVVLNILGQEVAEVANKHLDAGIYDFSWSAKNLSSGIYFYKLTTAQFASVRKMTLLK